MPGDIITGFEESNDFQEFIKANQGKEITLNNEREGEILEKKGKIEESLGVEFDFRGARKV